MKEDTDQLIHNARQVLDDAKPVIEDELAAPNAGFLADAAEYLLSRKVSYPDLTARLRRYLQLGAKHEQSNGNQLAAAGFWKRLAATHLEATLEHRLALLNAAGCMNKTGNSAKALELMRHIERLAETAGDDDTLETVKTFIAPALCETGQLREGAALLKEVMDSARAGGREQTLGRAACNAAIVARMLGDTALALQYCNEAIETNRRLGDETTVLRTRQTLASILIDEGRFDDALVEFRGIADAAAKMNERSLLGTAYGNIGTILLNTGDIEAGRAALERANEVFIETGATISVANTRLNIGASLVEEGLPERAEVLLSQAEAEFARLGNTQFRSMARLNLAHCHTQLGRLEEAARLLDAESYCESGSHVELRCFWHAVVGELAAARGDGNRARQRFEVVMRIAREHGLKDELARIAVTWARLELKTGQWRRALELAETAVDTLRAASAVPPLLLVDALVMGAKAALQLDNREVARRHLVSALELADELPLFNKPEGPRASELLSELQRLEATALV